MGNVTTTRQTGKVGAVLLTVLLGLGLGYACNRLTAHVARVLSAQGF